LWVFIDALSELIFTSPFASHITRCSKLNERSFFFFSAYARTRVGMQKNRDHDSSCLAIMCLKYRLWRYLQHRNLQAITFKPFYLPIKTSALHAAHIEFALSWIMNWVRWCIFACSCLSLFLIFLLPAFLLLLFQKLSRQLVYLTINPHLGNEIECDSIRRY
jgi:hypothetical protein